MQGKSYAHIQPSYLANFVSGLVNEVSFPAILLYKSIKVGCDLLDIVCTYSIRALSSSTQTTATMIQIQ